ncbi:hypothetical protein [Moraxella lacunata]
MCFYFCPKFCKLIGLVSLIHPSCKTNFPLGYCVGRWCWHLVLAF